jgi:hypothetical protein
MTSNNAGVAQLVEQLICNQLVGGSSPLTSYLGEVPEWPKGTDCKSVGAAFEGSNPSSPKKSRSKRDFLFLLKVITNNL